MLKAVGKKECSANLISHKPLMPCVMWQDLRKGVFSCKSRFFLFLFYNFEAVIATDLKLALNILTSSS